MRDARNAVNGESFLQARRPRRIRNLQVEQIEIQVILTRYGTSPRNKVDSCRGGQRAAVEGNMFRCLRVAHQHRI